MGQYKKFWFLLVAVLIGAFSILGYYGFEIYREAPPIPKQYVTEKGEPVIFYTVKPLGKLPVVCS